MKTTFYILIFLFLIVSCKEKIEEVQSEIEKEQPEQNHFPVIIDTFQLDATYKVLSERDFGNYRPLYFGEKSDTLYVDYKLVSYAFKEALIFEVLEDKEVMKENRIQAELFNKKRESYSDYYKDLNFHFDPTPPTWEETKIKIFIDTSQIIRNIGRTKFKNKEFTYHAFPVILENISDSEIAIGYGSHLPLILEIKKQNEEWEAVEYPFTYACGNGLPTIVLPKNEIVLTSVPILKNGEGTKMRLKIGENYSEAF